MCSSFVYTNIKKKGIKGAIYKSTKHSHIHFVQLLKDL